MAKRTNASIDLAWTNAVIIETLPKWTPGGPSQGQPLHIIRMWWHTAILLKLGLGAWALISKSTLLHFPIVIYSLWCLVWKKVEGSCLYPSVYNSLKPNPCSYWHMAGIEYALYVAVAAIALIVVAAITLPIQSCSLEVELVLLVVISWM